MRVYDGYANVETANGRIFCNFSVKYNNCKNQFKEF